LGEVIPDQLKHQRFIKVKDKAPIEKNWQLEVGGANYSIDDKAFNDYLGVTKQYGVLCGYNGLIVIDFDDQGMMDEVLGLGILPKTFSVKTARKGLLHLYYYTDNCASWKILDKDKNTLADIQGKTKQVIGPGSRIPDGREYVVVDDLPIATIPSTLIHEALDRFDFHKNEEALVATESLTLDDFTKKFGEDTTLQEIKKQLKISDVLRDKGISTSKNPTKCPLHDSKGGKCFGFDDVKGVFHCFHCGEKGDVITLWQLVHGVTDFLEAKKTLCEDLSIEDTYIPPPLVAPAKNTLPSVQLPQDNRTLAQFAKSLATHFVGCEDLFFKVDERCIVEITEYYDKQLKQLIVGFSMVEPKRLLNLIEAKVNMYNLVKVKKGQVEVRRTPPEQTIKLLSANTEFLKALFEIKRFLNYPIPFITNEGELIIPGKGYDKRYQAYFTPNTPELKLMNPLEAKEILIDILSEFCFKDVLDRDMAISYLITPMCRGLYHSSNARTPLFIIQANRERAGKDYLAGVVGILYEGRAIDDTPLVTGDKGEANNDEWRKKFTSALKAGRRRIHSSNNRGFLNSAVLEQFLTSEVWTDRQLGSNTSLELNNEIDISLSANIGLTYTPDLWFRARPINLFYGEENPNERVYKRTDLWGYIKENRGLVLSAVYTLIKAWMDAGSPKSSIPFTSFPEWSRVIGGIMEYHGFNNPCINIEDDGIGGDKETQSMKELFTFMADYSHNHPELRGFTVSDIRRIVMEAQSSEDFEGFSGWDLNDKSFQTKFGVVIKRFVGRMFNCKSSLLGDTKVKLIIGVENNRAARVLYVFKIEKVNNNGIVGEVKEEKGIEEISMDENMPEQISDMDRLIGILSGRDMCNIDYLRINGVNDKTIKKALAYKIAFEPRSGFIKLLK
jgi:hypothetical protein